MNDEDLERRFHQAMVRVYEKARNEVGYNATVFLRMVSEQGGLAAARFLINTKTPSDGFTALWSASRLDLTVEAVTLDPDFSPLFSPHELQTARRRLADYGYHVA